MGVVMAVKAVRGAIQVSENKAECIKTAVLRLINEITEYNKIDEDEIISIIFSQTVDLTALNPASALRTVGFSEVALFCTQEPVIENSMERVIRVLISIDSDKKLKPVYLDGAKILRLDIVN
jgi:chorismate mutase